MSPPESSSSFTKRAAPVGPPKIGALLRLPWEAVTHRILRALHERGFDDIDAPQLAVLLWPGPEGMRPSDLAARMRVTKQALNYLLGDLERLGYLERHPDCEIAQPPLSSWGAKGYADVWLNPSNDWIYPHIDMAAERMVELVQRFPSPSALQHRALNQAARELMLAQASDWPLIITNETTAEYAKRRFHDHLNRCHYLLEGVERQEVEPTKLEALEHMDPIFPELDYRLFAT